MSNWKAPEPVDLVDLGFMDARSKLLDVAAFLDRVERAGQAGDFRVKAMREAVERLHLKQPERVKEMLLVYSDMSEAPIEKATMQGAIGTVKADR